MSGQSDPYRLTQSAGVREQIRAIAAVAKVAGKAHEFADLVERAVHALKTNPRGWGDPLYRAKTVDAVACRGILRPLVFRYVIYEEPRGVVLLSVEQFTDFA